MKRSTILHLLMMNLAVISLVAIGCTQRPAADETASQPTNVAHAAEQSTSPADDSAAEPTEPATSVSTEAAQAQAEQTTAEVQDSQASESKPESAETTEQATNDAAPNTQKIAAPAVVTPATAKEIVQQLDLTSLPKLNEVTVFENSPTSLQYDAKGKFGSTLAFYRAEFSDRQWKEISNPPPNEQYFETLFQKNGFYVKLSLSESSPEAIGVRITSLGNIDARTLPVPAGGESQNSSVPDQESYLYSSDVATVTKELRDLLMKNGWRPYRPADNDSGASLDYFFQNGVLLFTYVSSSPQFQNGRPIAGFSMIGALPFDFPVPEDATDIKLIPMLSQFEYVTNSEPAEIVSFCKESYEKLGWNVVAEQIEEADLGATLIVEPNDELRTMLTILPRDEGGMKVTMERVPSAKQVAELAANEPQQDSTVEEPAQPSTEDTPEEEMEEDVPDVSSLLADALDAAGAELGDDVRQALQDAGLDELTKGDADDDEDTAETPADEPAELPLGAALKAEDFPLPEGAQDVQRSAERRRIKFRCPGDGDTIDAFFEQALSPLDWSKSSTIASGGFSGTTTDLGFDHEGRSIKIRIETKEGEDLATVTVTGNGLQFGDEAPPATEPEEEMEAEEKDGLPIPSTHTSYSSSSSKYLGTMDVHVPATLEKVVKFYSRELPDRGWKLDESTRKLTDESASMSFTQEGKQLNFSARREGDEVIVELSSRDSAAAKADGILPKEGKARLLIGNASDKDVTIVINGKPYKVKAGVGADDPKNAMSLNVVPGKYTFSIQGFDHPPEAVRLALGQTWGIVVLDTGTYYSDAIY